MNKVFSQRFSSTSRLLIGVAFVVISATAQAASADKNSPKAADAANTEATAPIGRAINSQEIQINRYTTLANAPDESDEFPLAVTATIHFPRGYVTTVGDAVKYLLIRTGYELAPLGQMDDYVHRVFALRLPESNRVMGPYRVDSMLQALLGPAFTLKVDQSLRLVSYTTKSPTPVSSGSIPPVDTTTNKPDGSSVIRQPEPQQVSANESAELSAPKVAVTQSATQP